MAVFPGRVIINDSTSFAFINFRFGCFRFHGSNVTFCVSSLCKTDFMSMGDVSRREINLPTEV